MLDEMRVNDEQLDISDIRQLENADEIAHFFAKLRYDVDQRTNIPDYAVVGMGSEDMRQHIQKIELIGKDPEDGDISIYLYWYAVNRHRYGCHPLASVEGEEISAADSVRFTKNSSFGSKGAFEGCPRRRTKFGRY